MKYQEAKQDVEQFTDGDEVLRVFRGSITKAVEAGQKFALDHPRIQKKVTYETLRAGLKGETVRVPTFETLVDLHCAIDEEPRAYCEPPAIPETFDEFRKVALEYASNVWWYETLGLADLVKPASWQAQLSREGTPRAWPQVRERAVEWREKALKALDAWEHRLREKKHAREMIDTWVKDVLDNEGEIAARAEFKRLKQYDFIEYSGHNSFDPAKPDREQFTFTEMEESDWLPEYQERLEAGWSRYRPDDPKPDRVSRRLGVANFCDDYLVTAWAADCEFERHEAWDPFLRCLSGPERVVRIKVKRDARHALEGEEILRDKTKKYVDGRRVDEYAEYVWRWRDADELDTCVDAEVRDKAIKLGFAMVDGTVETPRDLLRDVVQPIEQDDPQCPRGPYTIS